MKKFLLFISVILSVVCQSQRKLHINGSGPTVSINASTGGNVYVGVIPSLTPSQGVAIGNSTVAGYMGTVSVPSLLFTSAEILAGYAVFSIALPGYTIAQQMNLWVNNVPNKSQYEWVIVQIGLNDMNPAEAASVAIARYQLLIDTIRALAPTIKIITSKMIPAKARWTTLWPADPAGAQAKWVAMNDAMIGYGPNKITGMDATITTHEPLLRDASGNLLPKYESDLLDGIHLNNGGRWIEANWWRMNLKKLGW